METREIFKLLQDEMRSASAAGTPIRMAHLGVEAGSGGRFVRITSCGGVCAMGAHLLGQQVHTRIAWLQFANNMGRSENWGRGFFFGSTPTVQGLRLGTEQDDYKRGFRFGQKVCKWVLDEQRAGRLP